MGAGPQGLRNDFAANKSNQFAKRTGIRNGIAFAVRDRTENATRKVEQADFACRNNDSRNAVKLRFIHRRNDPSREC